MRRYYTVLGGEELVKGIKPVYTEINYLCLNPVVLLIQKGNSYYIGELAHRSFDFVNDDVRYIGANTYLQFAYNDIIKNKGLTYNGYFGALEDGKQVEIMELLEEDEGKFIAAIDFKDVKEYIEFKKPTFFVNEIKSAKDFKNNGIVLRKVVNK